MAASQLREIKNGDSMELDVALPDLQPIECPLFTLKSTEWIFRFIKENTKHGFYYNCYIKKSDKNSNAQFEPFRFSYLCDVIDKNGKSLFSYQKNKKYENQNIPAHRFLEISQYSFYRENSSMLIDYSGWNIFKFSFTIYLPSEPNLKFKLNSHDKCVQNVSYSNADAPMGSLSKDFSELFKLGLNHDVKIRCGEHTLKVHKLILCTRSKVFKTMLQKQFREGRTGVIEIQDMDSSSFLDFMKYIYTDLLPELTPEKAMTLYETGDKYDVRSLLVRCSEYLQDNLSLENVYSCLILADAHSDEKLKSEAITYILRNKLDLQEEHWLLFCKNYPKIAFDVYKLSRKNITEK